MKVELYHDNMQLLEAISRGVLENDLLYLERIQDKRKKLQAELDKLDLEAWHLARRLNRLGNFLRD
jgi:hypothetical protein